MESKVYVPFSATQVAPVVAEAYPHKWALPSSSSTSVLTSSLPIRAPPNLDSNSDSESVGLKTFSTISSSGGRYNGYESDENFLTREEFESVSERAAEPDEEALEESENFAPLRPFVAYPDRKSLEISIKDEEENGKYGLIVELVLVDNPNLNRIMPKAQLSMNDDEEEEEDEIVGEVDEDSGFLGIVRVLNFKVLEEIDGSPRIKALVEWRDSITIEQSESPMEVKVVEVDKVVEAQNGVLGVGIEKVLVVERILHQLK
ncbi:hypothetical protein FH972_015388 [Carpinus fangiana]|uniref:Uncharacterized protein n=1 Tax=Carpinus fangiana TaxID=176857 RepID=A0A5N6RG70_9ROSI|nr:hypothetical protein FH972_015388 [Carpinus fangiana]